MALPTLCLVGGFLGAGKTTAILAAAQRLRGSGRSVGIVANDQGHELVDVSLAVDATFPSGRVEGGCFCCKFDDLVEQVDRLLEEARTDVLFAEAVGSCTDLSATVLNPLRRRHGDRFRLASITVVVDPRAVHDLLLEPSPRFSENLRYLFRKQIEEADVILLNKAEAYDYRSFVRSEEALAGANGAATILRTSARIGTGISEWLQELMTPQPSGLRVLDLDYERYGAAEAEMAWLNARARLSGEGLPVTFLETFLRSVTARLDGGEACLHLKTFLAGPKGSLWGAVTARAREPQVVHRGDPGIGPWTLFVNLRALVPPEEAARIVRRDLRRSANRARFRVRLETLETFRPAFPVPTYRETQPVLRG